MRKSLSGLVAGSAADWPTVWRYWRTPAAATLVVAMLVAVSYGCVDERLALWVEGLPKAAKVFFSDVTRMGDARVWWVLWGFIAVIASATSARKAAWRSLFICVCILVAGLSVDVLKLVFARYRPSMLVEQGLWGFAWFGASYDMAAFPSGHAATLLSMAAAASLFWPGAAVVWYGLGIALAATRVMTLSHYPSDVLAGGFVGVVTVRLLRRGCVRLGWWWFLGAAADSAGPRNAGLMTDR